MTIKEVAFKVEELEIQANKIDSLQSTLFSSIYQADGSLDTYEWAFFLLGELTFSMQKDLHELVNQVFVMLREEDSMAAVS